MISKSDVISLYSMEELIPIVAKLTEEFTAKESSSVTYERARQFMEAVIYFPVLRCEICPHGSHHHHGLSGVWTGYGSGRN